MEQEKKVFERIYGIVTKVEKKDGKTSIVIEKDRNPANPYVYGVTSDSSIDGSYDNFYVGEPVIQVIYQSMRPATKEDRQYYAHHGQPCPSEISEFSKKTYDKEEYEEKIRNSRTR